MTWRPSTIFSSSLRAPSWTRRKRPVSHSLFGTIQRACTSWMLSMDDLFKGRQFDREIIILCVRWYLRFKLSFRDLVEMMAERGISLAHTTIMRWIAALCSGVRKAVEPFRLPGRHILAGRRNLCEDQRQVDISLPCCRQARKDGGFSAPRQAGCCSRQSVFPAGVQEPGPAATKDHARRLSGLYGALEVKRCFFYVWLLCLVVAAACCARWSQDGTLLRLSEGNSPNRRGSSRHMLVFGGSMRS